MPNGTPALRTANSSTFDLTFDPSCISSRTGVHGIRARKDGEFDGEAVGEPSLRESNDENGTGRRRVGSFRSKMHEQHGHQPEQPRDHLLYDELYILARRTGWRAFRPLLALGAAVPRCVRSWWRRMR